MPDIPKQPGRQPFPDDEWILEKVAQLRRLETQSDPSNPDRQLLHQSEVADSAPLMKDQDATNALRVVRELIGATAGWALNHHVGRALNQVSPAPDTVFKGRGVIDPKLLASERRASADHHEPKGASYRFGDSVQDRRALAALVRHLAPVVSDHLAIHTEAALYALARGEAIAPLHPETTHKQGARFTLSILRLRAVQHREYLIGWGSSKAAMKVARAYNIAPDTIQDWASRLETELPGFSNVRAQIAATRHTGERARELSDKDGRTESEQWAFEEYCRSWDADALKHRGKQFQLLGRKKPRNFAKPKR